MGTAIKKNKSTDNSDPTAVLLDDSIQKINQPARIGAAVWLGLVLISLALGTVGGLAGQRFFGRGESGQENILLLNSDQPRVVVEKREQIQVLQDGVFKRLLEESGPRVVRVMKDKELIGMAVFISADGWLVFSMPAQPDPAVTFLAADGRILENSDFLTDVYSGLTFAQVNFAGVKPYGFLDRNSESLTGLVGKTAVWLAPRDGYGAPFIETQIIRGLYGGADKDGLFPLTRAARRLDTLSRAPFVGLPAVDVEGNLIGIADRNGLLMPADLIRTAWSRVERRAKFPDQILQSGLKYRPSLAADNNFSFVFYKPDGSQAGASLAAFGDSRFSSGDDLSEFLSSWLVGKSDLPKEIVDLLSSERAK